MDISSKENNNISEKIALGVMIKDSTKWKISVQYYKQYAKDNLPQKETLEGYWAPDFSIDNDDIDLLQLDQFDINKLDNYLFDLNKYVRCITEAASRRQLHYDTFKQYPNIEDIGHKMWREGMNLIAKDAQEKFNKWSNIRDKLFDKYITQSELQELTKRYSPPCNIAIKNVDLISIDEKKIKQKTKQKTKTKTKEKTRENVCFNILNITRRELDQRKKERAKAKRELKKMRYENDMKIINVEYNKRCNEYDKLNKMACEAPVFNITIYKEQVRDALYNEKSEYKDKMVPMFANLDQILWQGLPEIEGSDADILQVCLMYISYCDKIAIDHELPIHRNNEYRKLVCCERFRNLMVLGYYYYGRETESFTLTIPFMSYNIGTFKCKKDLFNLLNNIEHELYEFSSTVKMKVRHFILRDWRACVLYYRSRRLINIILADKKINSTAAKNLCQAMMLSDPDYFTQIVEPLKINNHPTYIPSDILKEWQIIMTKIRKYQ